MSDLYEVVHGEMHSLYHEALEDLLRRLLSKWVSEFEPALIINRRSSLDVLGLGVAGDPTGTVVIPSDVRFVVELRLV